MKGWLRRLRGVLGIGTLWGAVGTAVGSVAGLVVSLSGGLPLLDTLVEFGMGAGGLGFGLGSAFAVVLTTLEKRRTLDELTPGRAAGWGAVAGGGAALVVGVTLVPALFPVLPLSQLVLLLISGTVSYGALTAGLAAGSVALARRAPSELSAASELDDGNLLASPRGD
jgi:hypothetical protein